MLGAGNGVRHWYPAFCLLFCDTALQSGHIIELHTKAAVIVTAIAAGNGAVVFKNVCMGPEN